MEQLGPPARERRIVVGLAAVRAGTGGRLFGLGFAGGGDDRAFFKQLAEQVNATLPSTHRVSKVIVRKEDFKRTGSLKVSRKDN